MNKEIKEALEDIKKTDKNPTKWFYIGYYEGLLKAKELIE